MQDTNTLYDNIIGALSSIECDSEGPIQVPESSSANDSVFYAKIRKLVSQSIDKFGTRITSVEFGLPLDLCNKIKLKEKQAVIKQQEGLVEQPIRRRPTNRMTYRLKEKVISMYSEGYPAADIAMCNDLAPEEVRKVIMSSFSLEYYRRKEASRETRARALEKRRLRQMQTEVQQTRGQVRKRQAAVLTQQLNNAPDYSLSMPDLVELS